MIDFTLKTQKLHLPAMVFPANAALWVHPDMITSISLSIYCLFLRNCLLILFLIFRKIVFEDIIAKVYRIRFFFRGGSN